MRESGTDFNCLKKLLHTFFHCEELFISWKAGNNLIFTQWRNPLYMLAVSN